MQVGDTRPSPLPDGADVQADASDGVPSDTTPDATVFPDVTGDVGDDAPAPDVGPVACGSDGECAAGVCSVGRCVEGQCVFAAAPPGTACDDGNQCTPNDACQGALCAGSGQLLCNDQDPCTDDRCTPSVGCDFAPKSCDDGDACTTDACRPGVGCVATPLTCPGSGDSCSTSVCDPERGCVATPNADGIACDDGRECTVDVCLGGQCVSTASGCDDDNPCTSDACLPEGGCNYLPIIGCSNDDSCLGRLAGAACDDGEAGTSADMCLAGDCRGYTLTRIPGTTVPGQQGLVVTEIDDGPGGWSAVLWTLDSSGDQSYALADISNPATPTVAGGTLQGALIAGLRDGFAGDEDGRLWHLEGGRWNPDNAWDDALGQSGRDAINAVFTVHGTGVGDARTGLTWVVGGYDSEWLRLCRQSGSSVVCSAQLLDNADGDSVPRAIGGVPNCDTTGNCTGASLVIGADAWLGGGFNYTDTFENPTGLAATWEAGELPDAPANRETRAVAVWRDDSGLRALVVGDNGYLLQRRGDGSWRGQFGLLDNQSARDFSGVWVGAGVVIASAERLGSNGTAVVAELWVAPLDSDLANGNSWTIHELGRYPVVDASGVYDIAGKSDGEVRVVGAVRRANGQNDWLDGAVWVRSR